MAVKKRTSITTRAGDEADKKKLTGKDKKRYVGGAYNRARLEKAKKAAPATPAKKKAYSKPALTTLRSKDEHQQRKTQREKKKHTRVFLNKMRRADREGEKRRRAQIAALTPEQVKRQNAVREQQIRTAERRSAPMRPLNRQPIHLQDKE